jgi:hypothetical protein
LQLDTLKSFVDADDSKSLEEKLLDQDAETLNRILAKDQEGICELYWRCIWKSSFNCLELMISGKFGCDINAKYGSEKNTALHIAARNNDEKLLDKLIQLGADRNLLNGAGLKPAGLTIDKTIHAILKEPGWE